MAKRLRSQARDSNEILVLEGIKREQIEWVIQCLRWYSCCCDL